MLSVALLAVAIGIGAGEAGSQDRLGHCASLDFGEVEIPAPRLPCRAGGCEMADLPASVTVRFDVSESGEPENIVVLQSPDDVYARLSTRQIARLRFEPGERCEELITSLEYTRENQGLAADP